MTTADAKKGPDQWNAYNYCISFIDLLGQRDALKGQGLLPIFKSEEDHKRFISTLKDSIGAIPFSGFRRARRIVVGPRVIAFLQAHKNNKDQDVFSANNRALAELCLSMLAQDADGFWILHYLGDQFRQAVTYSCHDELYSKARKYVEEQLVANQRSGNSKLAFRYSHLLLYFDAHRPDVEAQPAAAGDAQVPTRP